MGRWLVKLTRIDVVQVSVHACQDESGSQALGIHIANKHQT